MQNEILPFARSEASSCQPAQRRRVAENGVFHMQCHYCGYEPANAVPRRCPKCGGGAWERYVVPGSLLVAALHRRPEGMNFGRVCPMDQPPVWNRFVGLTETMRGDMLLEDDDVRSNPDSGG